MPKHPTPRQRIESEVKRFLGGITYPHSKAYLFGLWARFQLRISGYMPANPYRPGRPKFDAFRSGFGDAGRALLAERSTKSAKS